MIREEKKVVRFFFEKYISYGLHLGGLRSFRYSHMEGYIRGFRSNFCIYDLHLMHRNLRYALKFLFLLVISKKKILFVGSPCGLERDFSLLCRKYKHYHLDSYTDGFFTNFDRRFIDFTERPALIFCFTIVENERIKKEIKDLNLPIMAVVGTSDCYDGVDYSIPVGMRSWSTSLYLYNLLSLLLSFGQARKRRIRIRN